MKTNYLFCLLCKKNESKVTTFCNKCITKKKKTSGDLTFRQRLRIIILIANGMSMVRLRSNPNE